MRPRAAKLLRRTALAAAFAFEAAAAAWILAPAFVDDPIPALEARPGLQPLLDRDGAFLGWLRPESLECRIPVPLSSVSSNAVAAILAVEDSDFREHGAVDWAAAARALAQNIGHGRVISGASTISMQTASLATKRGRHSIAGKFLQTMRARRMECLHSKDEILEAYLNNLPFGGKTTGIEAAALHYFGTHASDMTRAEATYLAGIPQKPNAYRPDRHPAAAARRYATARRLAMRAADGRDLPEEPPPMRDFGTLSPLLATRGVKERAWPFSFLAARLRAGGGKERPRSTLSMRLCEDVEAILRRRTSTLRGVRDAAAVAIDNRTGEVVAYVGTLDFSSPAAGQVDAARAVRSAGSTLKPFIYGEAVAGGLIAEDTIIHDAPLRYRDYMPLNFTREWYGRVSARDALAQSLNAPAVILAARLGVDRVAAALRRFGLEPATENYSGLSIVFGTGGHTLLDLARAYSALASGTLKELQWTLPLPAEKPAAARGEEPLHPGARAAVLRMMRSRRLDCAPEGTAWKTGTSNGLRDAWCIACTPRWTVGVWFGNKDGSPSEDLVGGVCAAPAAGEIMTRLRGESRVEDWDESELCDGELCAESGLAPSARCTARKKGRTVRGLPVEQCRMAHAGADSGAGAGRPLIISPRSGAYAIDPGEESVRLKLEASEPGTVFLVDGVPAEGTHSFREGRHTVEAMSDRRSEKTVFTVERL